SPTYATPGRVFFQGDRGDATALCSSDTATRPPDRTAFQVVQIRPRPTSNSKPATIAIGPRRADDVSRAGSRRLLSNTLSLYPTNRRRSRWVSSARKVHPRRELMIPHSVRGPIVQGRGLVGSPPPRAQIPHLRLIL